MGWLFPTIAWGLGGAAVVLFVWALFWDRARGRRRCPRCWYDMGGASPDEDGRFMCPECGRIAKNERKLLKTRRRWWRALAALPLVAVAGGLGVTPALVERGPIDTLPPSLLLLFYDRFDDVAKFEIVDRLIRDVGELSSRQRQEFGIILAERFEARLSEQIPIRREPQDQLVAGHTFHDFTTNEALPFLSLGVDVNAAVDQLFESLDRFDDMESLTILSLVSRLSPTDPRLSELLRIRMREGTVREVCIAGMIATDTGKKEPVARELMARFQIDQEFHDAFTREVWTACKFSGPRSFTSMGHASMRATVRAAVSDGNLRPLLSTASLELKEWLFYLAREERDENAARQVLQSLQTGSAMHRITATLLMERGWPDPPSDPESWRTLFSTFDGNDVGAAAVYLHDLHRTNLVHNLLDHAPTTDDQVWMLEWIADTPVLWTGIEPHLIRIIESRGGRDLCIMAAQLLLDIDPDSESLRSALASIVEDEEDVLLRVPAMLMLQDLEAEQVDPP